MQFSRLDDTSFPGVANINPYAIRNEFDYTRWNAHTRLKLMSVRWDAAYSDVVKFDDDYARDRWFDKAPGETLELDAPVRLSPDGRVRVPLAYDVAAGYNYVMVDMPIATSEADLMQGESADGRRRWYLFVNSVRYLAPSTTELEVSVDVWTNYINDVSLGHAMVERGHIAVARSDVDAYLKDPLHNSSMLLADDVDYGGFTRVAHDTRIPIMDDEKWLCFAMTFDASSAGLLGDARLPYDVGRVRGYADSAERWGWQLNVNIDRSGAYDSMRTPVSHDVTSSDGLPAYLTVLAIRGRDVTDALWADIKHKCPTFYNACQACFMVSGLMIEISDRHVSIAGHAFYVATHHDRRIEYTLSKENFGYQAKVADYAKLYTYPYARLEVTDNAGTSHEVRIEDTGHKSIDVLTSLALPALNVRCRLNGVGGEAGSPYEWRSIDGSVRHMYGQPNDWYDNVIDMGIPTYALYVDGETELMLNGGNTEMSYAVSRALTGYHNAVRTANTQHHNALDADATAETNAINNNAQERMNAVAMADTIKANQNSNDKNMRDTAANTASNIRACNGYTVAAASACTAESTRNSVNIADFKTMQNTHITESANLLTSFTTSDENQRTTSMAAASHTSLVSQGGSAAAQSFVNGVGSALNGNLGGMLSGVANAFIGSGASAAAVSCNDAQAGAVINANSAIAKSTQDFNTTTTIEGNSFTRKSTNVMAAVATYNTNAQNSAATSTANSNASMLTTNAGLTATTLDYNAGRTHDASVNAAKGTEATGNASAGRTRATMNSNAEHTAAAAVANAKETLGSSVDAAYARLADARMARPSTVSADSGDVLPDAYHNRAYEVRVRTEPESAIMMAASQFARYGYALNQAIDLSHVDLRCMDRFSYWKATDVWVSGTGDSNGVVTGVIRKAFEGGVTVWARPEEIGSGDVYDNHKR